MAMFPYVDPHHHNTMWPSHYHGHRHHGGWLTPMLSTPEMTDPMLDRSMHTLAGLPRGLGEMNLTHEGDFEWKCSVAGFRPEELKVDLEGNQLVVSGQHSESREGESVERRFQRRVVLPQGVAHDPDSIKCSIDANGVLEIEARRPRMEAHETHNIPIEVKGHPEEGHHKEGLFSKIKHKLTGSKTHVEAKEDATRA